ncbi:probable serine/threonine-protein kinase dyrk2 isoform X1 [Tetranychus urticae]|uniref:Uncharacterized protein n=1 Tax=Tetranychus urticae TaxID=32264 RepID=T1KRZ3_TETUR|nr:probable serine/threonine-protein kinase dyrk2 isoform X1 [Tetranychus urticae]
MMVLIMANINYLVILICSTVFLLSSFVSSQQKLRNLEDPTEFFKYALYLRTDHPEYYAKNFKGITDHYNKLISATEAKRLSLNTRSSDNNGQPNSVFNSAGPRTPMQHDGLSRWPPRIPQGNNASPSRPKSEQKAGRTYSRSLSSTVSPKDEAIQKVMRDILKAETTNATNPDLDWARKCFTLGYNNTNGSCQSEPEVIKLAPNETICLTYFKFGCQYQLNQDFCVAGVDEVMKNTSFTCDLNINGDSELMSIQCCMACKSGINAAISKDSCDMHLDNSMPSFAQEKCCNSFLNQNISVSTTESIPVSFKPGSMNAIMSDLDDQVSNSTTFKLSNSLDSTTESIKPGSLNEVVVHLDDRFSNNETNKPEIDSSTVPETSTLPTTTTTIATPSTSTESTTAPSTTTTAATTTTITTELTTTTSTTTNYVRNNNSTTNNH